MENVVKVQVKFCCSAFLKKRSSKVPRIFHDRFHAIFHQTLCNCKWQISWRFSLCRRLSLKNLAGLRRRGLLRPDSGVLCSARSVPLCCNCENNSDHPHPPYLQKICPQNMPYNGGLYGVKVGQNQGVSTEMWHTHPKTVAHEPPPPFMPYEPSFYMGVGVVVNLLKL